MNNYLVQNVSRALVSRLTVKFDGTPVQDTNGYDIFKTFEDLFLSVYECDEMLIEGIQDTTLCKIRSNSGEKPTSGVDAEKKLAAVYNMKYKINLNHQILTSSGVFYPKALKDLTYQLPSTPTSFPGSLIFPTPEAREERPWSRVQLTFLNLREGSFVSKTFVAYSFVQMKVRLTRTTREQHI